MNKEVKVNDGKVAIIGCGFVGSATAFALMESGLFRELVLVDVNMSKAEGEAMDISHGVPFAKPMKIYAGTYDDVADAAIIIITAGAAQKPGETRLQLVQKNVSIFKSIIPEISRRGFAGILLIVSNPVDILTYVAQKLSGLPENRVIGSGTVLDTARLKAILGEHLEVDNRTVDAFVIGEHGDSELVAWSAAVVSGLALSKFCEMRGHFNHDKSEKEIQANVKDAAYEIINRKGATYYGVAMAVRRICEVIVRNEKTVLSVSSLMNGEYGIDDICLSMPAIVSSNGVENKIPIALSESEITQLMTSAKTLKSIASELDLTLPEEPDGADGNEE